MFSFDSVMTVAVTKTLMDTYGKDNTAIRAALVRERQTFDRAYPGAGYGGRFGV